jgi:hypothetical protein
MLRDITADDIARFILRASAAWLVVVTVHTLSKFSA